MDTEEKTPRPAGPGKCTQPGEEPAQRLSAGLVGAVFVEAHKSPRVENVVDLRQRHAVSRTLARTLRSYSVRPVRKDDRHGFSVELHSGRLRHRRNATAALHALLFPAPPDRRRLKQLGLRVRHLSAQALNAIGLQVLAAIWSAQHELARRAAVAGFVFDGQSH